MMSTPSSSSSWPLGRSFWYSVGLFVVFNSIFLTCMLLKPGTHDQFVIIDDVGQALGWLLGTLLCFVGLRKSLQFVRSGTASVPETRMAQRWIPLFFAAGIFCQFVGQVIYTYYDLHHWNPFPSWADVAYLSTFPFFLAGVALLPTRPHSSITRSRVMIDGFMIMTALVTFSWYFVLGPTMLQGQESLFATIVGSAYPFFDLVLIFCVLRLSFRAPDPILQPVIRLLSLGFIVIVLTDSIYDYLTLHNNYTNGLQDLGWPIGYMLIGLAAQAFNGVLKQKRQTTFDTDEYVSQEWHGILPYALIPMVVLLTVYTWMGRENVVLGRGVYFGGIALIGLVVLRQFFTVRETIYYNKELHSMQQALQEKNEALNEANIRLEAQANQIAAAYEQQLHVNELKDQFLLNVNHELRTPLTEIHGYLNLLSEYQGKIDEQMQATFLDHAVHGCEELLSLVNNVLEAIRGDALSRSPQYTELPLLKIVDEVLDLFEPQKREDYRIKVEVDSALIVRADEQHLHRILLNLLSNAFKYSPTQTTITIRALPDEQIPSESEQSTHVIICVQDEGAGIPPAEILTLFEKFVRLKRDLVGTVRGTGLGLYICKQLVEAMDGRIWAESMGIAGLGSSFYFTLPTAQQTSKEENQEAVLL